ncbi:MAG TPA: metal-dependent hydrolase, partial [Spirochaetota bacterium]|nr:metal-dependent hydrolase [Spirochaetota bacterium]
VKEALVGRENDFRDVLDIVIAYEKGEWDLVAGLLQKFGIDEHDFPEIYGNAADWVNKIFY